MIVYNQFPYWIVIVGTIVLIILLGFVCIKLFEPSKKRKKVPVRLQREIAKQHYQKAAREGAMRTRERSEAYRRTLK
jgi:p-aminobenzoyl-glutamate transporter AbgT